MQQPKGSCWACNQCYVPVDHYHHWCGGKEDPLGPGIGLDGRTDWQDVILVVLMMARIQSGLSCVLSCGCRAEC